MGKRAWANKVDANQKDIIKELLKYPGVSVATDHHDVLVGFRKKTGWYEIKNTNQLDKDGNVYESAKKKSQKKLDREWTGHREYATTAEEILIDMGVIK